MSSLVSTGERIDGGEPEAPRRHLSSRQAATVERLVAAVLDELHEVGYDALTVRNVARRAGVAAATAYTYFASREHLVTEVFWRRLESLATPPLDRRRSRSNRVSATLGAIALRVAEEPELASACTVAMLSGDPEVKLLRGRIGRDVHRRLLAAANDEVDPAQITAIELAFFGAMVQAGGDHITYAQLPDLLEQVVGLVMGGSR